MKRAAALVILFSLSPLSLAHAQADPDPKTEALERKVQALEARVDELAAQAELRELENRGEQALIDINEPKLLIYGFMDSGYERWFLDGGADDEVGVLRPTKEGTFVFGNLNLYLDASIGPAWQALIEVRYTLAPHGEEISLGPPLGDRYARTDTTAFDYASPSAQNQIRLGSLYIERAYTEWKPIDWFRLRVGMFLNPFGIWNVDHGSPTLIALALPTFVAGQMMPGRLIGVEAFGALTWGNKRLDYMLHVTNGRTPLDYDLTDNKAIGGRLAFTWDWNPSNIVIGASTYQGTYEDEEKVVDLAAASMPGKGYFDWKTVVAYSEHVYGLDVALTVGPVRVYAEGVARLVYYEQGKRDAVFDEKGGTLYAADRLEWDAYVIAAYRAPVLFEPYLMFEGGSKAFVLPRFAGEARASSADRRIYVPSIGLNLRITAQIRLKFQGQAVMAYDAFSNAHLWNAYAFYSRLVTTF